jgi:hypothetical protein
MQSLYGGMIAYALIDCLLQQQQQQQQLWTHVGCFVITATVALHNDHWSSVVI